MQPEARARQLIDGKLEQAGWVILDLKQLNLGANLGVAVREYPTDTGPADYVLFVNRIAVGVIEAKKDAAGENRTVTESQTERYATANLKWRKDNTPLRFLFEATGQIIRFTDNSDAAPRSREIFRLEGGRRSLRSQECARSRPHFFCRNSSGLFVQSAAFIRLVQ